MFAVDAEGRFLALNPACERLFGLARDELFQLLLTELVALDSLPVVLDLLRGRTQGRGRRLWDVDIVQRDGRRVAVELSVEFTLDGDAVRSMHVVARNISTRQPAEGPRNGIELPFRVLVEHGADGLFLVSIDGRILYASEPVGRVLGYAPADVTGLQFTELVHPDDRGALSGLMADAIKHPAAPLHAEYRCLHREKNWRWHQAVLVNLLAQPGVNAILINFRDATEGRAAEAALHESEQRFRAVFNSALMGIVRTSLGGEILEVNRAMLDMSGFSNTDMVGQPLSEFIHDEDRAAALTELHELAAGGRPSSRAERRYLASGGRPFWANATTTVVRDETGAPQFILQVLDNITERKQAEDELRDTNQRLSIWVQELEQRTREISLLSDMGDLLQACRSPEEACRVMVPVAGRLFVDSAGVVSLVADGSVVYPQARWGATPALDPFGLTECWALRRGRPHVVTSRSEGPFCRHLEPLEGSGAMCVPMMAHGELLGVLSLVVRDGATLTEPRQRLVTTVSEHVSLALANLKLEETLRSQSIRDPLTGLFNRRYMEESLEREMRRSIRNRTSVGIIMLDIDHFKAVNDAHGHEGGDVLLRAIGGVLQRSIRAEDIACRFGGEEFTLILPEASLHEAAQRAEALRQAVKQLVVPHRRHPLPTVTVSAGVAAFPDHGPSAEAVLRAADTALYQAKMRGRDRVILNQMGGLFPESLVEFGRRT